MNNTLIGLAAYYSRNLSKEAKKGLERMYGKESPQVGALIRLQIHS